MAPDEAYYWVWSHALAPGYLDHPPMVALWIRAGTLLAGEGNFGVRLLGPFAAALGTVLLVRAGDDLLPGRGAGLRAAVLMNATLLFAVGATTMTPDTPLLLFWTMTLWALARLHATGRGHWWLVAGVAAGLALDSKYTAALLAPAILLWLAAVPAMWVWLRRWQPYAAGLLAFEQDLLVVDLAAEQQPVHPTLGPEPFVRHLVQTLPPRRVEFMKAAHLQGGPIDAVEAQQLVPVGRESLDQLAKLA